MESILLQLHGLSSLEKNQLLQQLSRDLCLITIQHGTSLLASQLFHQDIYRQVELQNQADLLPLVVARESTKELQSSESEALLIRSVAPSSSKLDKNNTQYTTTSNKLSVDIPSVQQLIDQNTSRRLVRRRSDLQGADNSQVVLQPLKKVRVVTKRQTTLPGQAKLTVTEPTAIESQGNKSAIAESVTEKQIITYQSISISSTIDAVEIQEVQIRIYNDLIQLPHPQKPKELLFSPEQADETLSLLFNSMVAKNGIKHCNRILNAWAAESSAEHDPASAERAQGLIGKVNIPLLARVMLRNYSKLVGSVSRRHPDIEALLQGVIRCEFMKSYHDLLNASTESHPSYDPDLVKALKQGGYSPRQGRDIKTAIRNYIATQLDIEPQALKSVYDNSSAIYTMSQVLGYGPLLLTPNLHSKLTKLSIPRTKALWPCLLRYIPELGQLFDILSKRIVQPIQQGQRSFISVLSQDEKVPILQRVIDLDKDSFLD